MNIQYNLQEAKDYPRNAFDFDLPIENTLLGQTSVPEHPAEDGRGHSRRITNRSYLSSVKCGSLRLSFL